MTASNGKTVPAGATVIVATYKLHRREDIYPNPDKFDPDNFLPERSANRHYYAFVPFSAGPRSCVGESTDLLAIVCTNHMNRANFDTLLQVASTPC